ncbi:OLC1v1024555C1 [Oldenlandia corymbosa var. corymbosa]|uniref:OLC1v1024555C1 n=1 Tax=Oldenlandia corymbosa var. corymbosa TaxID=529605 RepID=A0AAV1C4E5_OLDCO|nr:OLC1v1024555C1 [Oldenlandia corymbosa var. corymbosa]
MMKVSSSLLVFVATLMVALAPLMAAGSSGETPKDVEKWYKQLSGKKEKLTTIHFFFQDVVSGKTPTAVEIARSRLTGPPTFFGLTRVFDDPLTVTGSPKSKTIGYGQGIYSLTSQEDLALLFTFNFVFTDGKYKGSTLSVQGHNPLEEKYREMAIIGGSGIFRLARGSAVASTYWANATSQDVSFHGLMTGEQAEELPTGPPHTFTSFFQKPIDNLSSKGSLVKEVRFVNGVPILEYEEDEYDQLVAPHQLSLIRKFSYGRPKMEEVHKEFKKLGFHGGYTLGLMNPRHVLIRFQREEDYQRSWIETSWNIARFSMRILKWRPGFKFEKDPPIVPIWVSLFDLRIEKSIWRPSVARFYVEVDLTKEFLKSVKVGKKGKKHDQIFTYEHIPAYCTKCNKIGHKKEDCRAGLQKAVDKKKKAPVKIVDRAKTKEPLHVHAAKPQEKSASNPSAQEKAATKQDATNPSAQGGAATASVAATDRPSSSGLFAKEKKTIPVDVHDTATEDQSKEASRLPDSPPQVKEPGSDEDFIESVYVEDSPNKEVEEMCRVDDHVESRVLALMSLTETPHIFSDDGDIGLHGAGLENDTGSWSKGEKDEVLVHGDVRGDFMITKKRGRKSKEERARSQVDKLDEIKPELAFDTAYSSNNSKIWFFCKSEIHASLLSDDDQVLHFEIKHPLVSRSYILSAVSLEEYSGVSVQDHSAIEDFNMCIQACNLLEIEAVGEDFTWGGTRNTGWETQRSLRRLNSFFEQYEKATGQKISRGKSSFVASEKCSSRRIEMIKETLGMQHGSFPFTYLGCRIFNGRKKAAIFQFLLDAMDAKLLNWKNKFLSPGRRLMLIWYALSYMPLHVFSAIPPPKSIIRAMEPRCQKFLWEGSSEVKKRHCRSSERVTFQENGLGLRSFDAVISALTSKLWWKLKNNKGIWSAFLHSLSHSAKEKTSWARVMKVGELAITFSKIIVRNGDRSFWYDNWGPNGVF